MDDAIKVTIEIYVYKSEVENAHEFRNEPMPENWQSWAEDTVKELGEFWNESIESELSQQIYLQQELNRMEGEI